MSRPERELGVLIWKTIEAQRAGTGLGTFLCRTFGAPHRIMFPPGLVAGPTHWPLFRNSVGMINALFISDWLVSGPVGEQSVEDLLFPRFEAVMATVIVCDLVSRRMPHTLTISTKWQAEDSEKP